MSVSSSEQNDTADHAVDILALAGILWREKYRILGAGVLAAIAMLFYVRTTVDPLFPSTASVMLEANEQNVITDIESVISGSGNDALTLNTEALVLRSRVLIGQIVESRNLVEDPEFNPRLRPPQGLEWVLTMIGLATRGTLPEDRIFDLTVDELLGKVVVTNRRQSLVFDITFTTLDPDKSALLANTLAQTYVDSQIQTKFNANQRATQFLTERAAELKQTLESMEAGRNTFFERDRTITPEALAAASAQLRELRMRMAELEAEWTESEAVFEQLSSLTQDPQAFALASEDTRLGQTIRRRGAGDRLVQDSIAAILARRMAELTRIQQQIAALKVSEQQLDEQVARQGQELIELQQLERELEATRLLYESFLTRLKETNVQQGLETPDSQIISAAVPRHATSPRTLMIAVMTFLLSSMGVGLGLVVREIRFAGFRTSKELQDVSALTVMGSVPMQAAKDRISYIEFFRENPNSVQAEAVRNLRTSLLMSNLDNPPKVILMTSSVPSEGKTTMALTLAMNMKGLGKEVLLIEADIRRCTLGEYIDTTKTANIVEALHDPESLRGKELHISTFGIDVLVGAKSKANAADVFASDRFAEVIKAARDAYDVVIIDSPPVLAVPDARIIRPLCDACLYVVRWNQTTRTQVQQGLSMFPEGDIDGLVLNQVDHKQMGKYGYGGQYGYDTETSSYYNS